MRSFGLTNTTLALAALTAVLAGCNSSSPGAGGATPTGDATTNTSGSATAARPAPTGPGAEVTGDEIKIGLVASQNGDLRPWGEDSVNGAQLAVDEVNAAGGINGKKVRLMIADSASNPEGGKSAAEKLVSDGVVALVGEVASGITMQMANVAFEKGLPIVAVGATRVDITQKGNNVFRVCYTDDFQGPVMAKFAYDDLGLRNVAMMTDKQQPYSVGLSDSFRKMFESLGGKIVDEQFYESKQTQFLGQLTTIASKNPDGLFLSGYFTEVGPIARQAKQNGLNVKLLGGDGWDSTELTTSGGDAIIGGYFCNHYNNQEDRPIVQTFLSKWKAKYGKEPGTTMGALGYDGLALTMDAIKRASAMNSKAIIEALENTENFPGVSGTITLKGQGGNPPKRALVVEVTKTGQVFKKAFEADSLKPAA